MCDYDDLYLHFVKENRHMASLLHMPSLPVGSNPIQELNMLHYSIFHCIFTINHQAPLI